MGRDNFLEAKRLLFMSMESIDTDIQTKTAFTHELLSHKLGQIENLRKREGLLVALPFKGSRKEEKEYLPMLRKRISELDKEIVTLKRRDQSWHEKYDRLSKDLSIIRAKFEKTAERVSKSLD